MRTAFLKVVIGMCIITFAFSGLTIIFAPRTWDFINPNKLLLAGEKRDLFDKVPEIFDKEDLWRMDVSSKDDEDFVRRDEDILDRWLFQREWAKNFSRSDYKKSIKRKKLILATDFDGINYDLNCEEIGDFSDVCEIVEDNLSYPQYHNYDKFDAILSRRDWKYQFYESPVGKHSISLFSILESPYTLHQGDFRVNNPILSSYWRGSDIEAPYYKWIPFGNTTTNSAKKNYAEGKRKLVAMVVSHCPTYNDRLRYVRELQKYIPVDVYGKCGNPELTCGKDCFQNISRDYKFYLAFENANCRDYITEKFFSNSLGSDIVPIVLGAHRDDYVYASPPNSYIHVEDFPTVKDLAHYIVLLDQNDDMYNKYFMWKGTGRIVNGHGDFLCKICTFLHYADFHPPKRKWPKSSYSWLKVNPCLEPGKHFWGSFRHF